MSGLDLQGCLVAQRCNIPTIVTRAFRDEVAREQIPNVGAYRFLSTLIEDEHPQTVSMVQSKLSADRLL